MGKAISILILENATSIEDGGNTQGWIEEAQQAFGLAATDEFDLIIGMTEDGECPVICDRTSAEEVIVESVMR